MKYRLSHALLTGTLVLGLASSAAVVAQTTQNSAYTGSIQLPQQELSDAAEAALLQEKAKVMLTEAVKTAQTALDTSAQPASAELDDEHGYLIWEIVIGSNTVIVDAGNAEILQTMTEKAGQSAYTGSIKLSRNDTSDDAEAARLLAQAKVDMSEAVATARGAVTTNARPVSAELDDDNGYLVWEVVVGNQVVIVDAGNAKVLQTTAVDADNDTGADEDDD